MQCTGYESWEGGIHPQAGIQQGTVEYSSYGKMRCPGVKHAIEPSTEIIRTHCPEKAMAKAKACIVAH